MDQVALHAFRDAELARPRHQEPGRLARFGYKVYAQNDEDGIIAEIFRRIGTKDRTFVEFGVEAGRECNSLWLLMQGWRGLWIEAEAEYCRMIAKTHARWLGAGALSLREAFITKTNINELIGASRRRHRPPQHRPRLERLLDLGSDRRRNAARRRYRI